MGAGLIVVLSWVVWCALLIGFLGLFSGLFFSDLLFWVAGLLILDGLWCCCGWVGFFSVIFLFFGFVVVLCWGSCGWGSGVVFAGRFGLILFFVLGLFVHCVVFLVIASFLRFVVLVVFFGFYCLVLLLHWFRVCVGVLLVGGSLGSFLFGLLGGFCCCVALEWEL